MPYYRLILFGMGRLKDYRFITQVSQVNTVLKGKGHKRLTN